MTIDAFEKQFWCPEETIERIQRDDHECKETITFRGVYTWDEMGKARMTQLQVKYDRKTREITVLTILGFNLQSVCEYADRHNRYLWNDVNHYITDFTTVPQKIYLFTPAYSV